MLAMLIGDDSSFERAAVETKQKDAGSLVEEMHAYRNELEESEEKAKEHA